MVIALLPGERVTSSHRLGLRGIDSDKTLAAPQLPRPKLASVVRRRYDVAAVLRLETDFLETKWIENVVLEVRGKRLLGDAFDEDGDPVQALTVVCMRAWLPE
jgi:hypothetical protein